MLGKSRIFEIWHAINVGKTFEFLHFLVTLLLHKYLLPRGIVESLGIRTDMVNGLILLLEGTCGLRWGIPPATDTS